MQMTPMPLHMTSDTLHYSPSAKRRKLPIYGNMTMQTPPAFHPVACAPVNHALDMHDMYKSQYGAMMMNPAGRVMPGDVTVLRRGKWLPEEEDYAASLIEDFKLGLLQEVSDGSTLRVVLAKSLRCSAMRVSKKYSGGLIGKVISSSLL